MIKEKKVDSTKAFYTKNGQVIHSVKELLDYIRKITPDEFRHHINEERNDFSNWIEHVFNDKKLADEIRKVKSRYEFVKVLEDALGTKPKGKSTKTSKKSVKKTSRKAAKKQATKTQSDKKISEIADLKLKEIEKREKKILEVEQELERRMASLANYGKFRIEEFVQGLLIGAIVGFAIAIALISMLR